MADAVAAAPAELPTSTVDAEDTEPEESLRRQFSEIAQLAGGLAHEIRNPLSTMQLTLELLAEDFPNPETQRDRRILQKIERVRSETKRLQAILEDFLRFVRVQKPRKQPAELNALVDDLRDFCEPKAAAQNVIVRMFLDKDLPLLSLDVDLFKQALLNLILNALIAMPSGGELILTTRREGRWVTIEIVDTGSGIAPEVREKVFDPFFSTRPGGSGLGLPTTRRIVEAHGGSIGLDSEPGKGSKFTVRLPAEASAGPSPPASAQEA
ncbi:MAG TPA: ATP-binding protein [Isosphaeraceae bacterium]|nr:ATP-binding protein [Isosphaeraceae bacterium]